MAEYIEREAAERMLERICAPTYAIHGLSLVPTIEAEPVKHGRWIKVGESCGVDILECSVCHTIHPQYGDAFCRDCGAKMDLEEST